jgi:hypothetical protein
MTKKGPFLVQSRWFNPVPTVSGRVGSVKLPPKWGSLIPTLTWKNYIGLAKGRKRKSIKKVITSFSHSNMS